MLDRQGSAQDSRWRDINLVCFDCCKIYPHRKAATRGRVYLPYTSWTQSPWREAKKGIQEHEVHRGSNWSRGHRQMLHTGLFSVDYLDSLFYATRICLPREVITHNGLGCSTYIINSNNKQRFYSLAYRPISCMHFLNRSSLFLDDIWSWKELTSEMGTFLLLVCTLILEGSGSQLVGSIPFVGLHIK